jgi:hypothetical protein
MTYREGGPSDEGKVCLVKNVPGTGAGTAVLAGFDLSALLSCDARTCVLSTVLGGDLGRTIPVPWACANNGVGSPELEPTPAVPFALAQAAPNPFSKVTTITFSVPRAGPASLHVYDVRGRKTQVLVDDVLGPGRHSRTWDGRTCSGEPAAPGLYFYRLKTAGQAATGRVVFLR